MGGIDGWGISGEPSYRERVRRSDVAEGHRDGLRAAAAICRRMAKAARTTTAQRALLRAAQRINNAR